jgi:hypothetical protein
MTQRNYRVQIRGRGSRVWHDTWFGVAKTTLVLSKAQGLRALTIANDLANLNMRGGERPVFYRLVCYTTKLEVVAR